eukprot:1152155-Pelagomonas_calceolata.AAC.4
MGYRCSNCVKALMNHTTKCTELSRRCPALPAQRTSRPDTWHALQAKVSSGMCVWVAGQCSGQEYRKTVLSLVATEKLTSIAAELRRSNSVCASKCNVIISCASKCNVIKCTYVRGQLLVPPARYTAQHVERTLLGELAALKYRASDSR